MTADRQDDDKAPATSRRSGGAAGRRRTHATRRGGPPRVMILAGVVIVLGALALFWPQRGGQPGGIGEQRTVVTAGDSTGGGQDVRPPVRSGDVDIAQASPDLVAEQPAGGDRPQSRPATKTKTTNTNTTAVPSTPAEPATRTAPPASSGQKPAAGIKPQSAGDWVVQAGAFGNAANADRDALRLRELGWDARVHAGANSGGQTIYRVWIGYFASKEDARSFIDSQRDHLSGAIALRR